MMPRFNRILLTGAAGGLGTVIRQSLRELAPRLRVSDVKPLTAASPNEEVVTGDLADLERVVMMTEQVDCVVHMGGAVGPDLPFEQILQSNLIGFRNLYEASRRNGVKRVIWGSSNHAIGFYPRTQIVDAHVPLRPDSMYGVSKAFGEAMAQYYWDKFRLESVSIRIGSCFPKPTDVRMLSTWQSYPDLMRLIECCLRAPRVEHTIVYGVSNNDSRLWDNRLASHLGYHPQDNAEIYRAEIEAVAADSGGDGLRIAVHGGSFAEARHDSDDRNELTRSAAKRIRRS